MLACQICANLHSLSVLMSTCNSFLTHADDKYIELHRTSYEGTHIDTHNVFLANYLNMMISQQSGYVITLTKPNNGRFFIVSFILLAIQLHSLFVCFSGKFSESYLTLAWLCTFLYLCMCLYDVCMYQIYKTWIINKLLYFFFISRT